MKVASAMTGIVRLTACGMLTFVAWHILDVLKAAIRTKCDNYELLLLLAGTCIAAVAYVAKGDKE